MIEETLESSLRSGELSNQLIQSEKTSSLGTLSDNISYHFNNLLSVILGYSSYISNREKVSQEDAQRLAPNHQGGSAGTPAQ